MNRIIKFRIWGEFGDTDPETFETTKKMLYSSEYANEHYEPIDKMFNNPDEEWMQWTGVSDKSGADCYEGDIVAVNLFNADDFPLSFGQIIFHAGCFFIQWIDDPEANMEPIGFHAKTGRPWVFEVIGNIYETPSLLESNKPKR